MSVDEIIRGVNIALAASPLDLCSRFDANRDGRIAIDELVSAVNNALFGCDRAAPTPLPTHTPTKTSLPTIRPTNSPVPTATLRWTATPTGPPTRTPTNDVAGHYEGTWRSDYGDGDSLSVDLSQSDNQVTGTVQIFGSDCFTGGAFTGTISGTQVSGAFTDGFTRVQVQLTLNGNRLNGTYWIQSGCSAGDAGNINLTRF